MKKKLLAIVLFILVLFSVGCGKTSNNGKSKNGILNSKKTMTCYKETVEDGIKTSETAVITYTSKEVLSVKSTSVSSLDPTYAELQATILDAYIKELDGLDGISASFARDESNQTTMVLDVEFKKINPEQIKEKLGDLYSEEDSYLFKTDYTIEEFKAENLEGYTCD